MLKFIHQNIYNKIHNNILTIYNLYKNIYGKHFKIAYIFSLNSLCKSIYNQTYDKLLSLSQTLQQNTK